MLVQIIDMCKQNAQFNSFGRPKVTDPYLQVVRKTYMLIVGLLMLSLSIYFCYASLDAMSERVTLDLRRQ